MSGADAEETQSVVEDGGQGPGAPTPLTVLEVIIATDHSDWKLLSDITLGCCRSFGSRYQTCGRWRFQYGGVSGVYVSVSTASPET